MCQRFSLINPELIEQCLLPDQLWNGMPPTLPGQEPREAIAPLEKVLAIFHPDWEKEPISGMLRWGLIPRWAPPSYPKRGHSTVPMELFLQSDAMFDLFLQQRCLIPADGFYEWKNGNKKRPYHFQMTNRDPFLLAGIWDRWNRPDGQSLLTCTILTTRANRVVEGCHSRMPVMLTPEKLVAWMSPDLTRRDQLLSFLFPHPADRMERRPVHTRGKTVVKRDNRENRTEILGVAEAS